MFVTLEGKSGKERAMPWNLIIVHSALFFIYVMVYIALLTSSLTSVGKLGPMEMNLWLLTSPVMGFFLFGFTFRRFTRNQFRKLLAVSLCILGVAIATLGLGVTAGAGSLCTGTGLLLFPLGTGIIYGYLHYLMCRWLPPGRLGLCIGWGFALPNLLQFLTDWLLKVTAAPPWFLWYLLLVLLAFMAALLLRTSSWGLEEQPVAPRPLIVRNLPLLCCIGAALGLLVGLNDTVSLVRYDEYVNYHFLSRVYSSIAYLLAGWLADRYPMWLPLTALLSKSVVLGFHAMAVEGFPFWITVCGDAFFTAALNLFLIWLFVSVARHTRRPELWAGMGRTAELPAAGLAGMLGSTLLQSFPFSVTLLVYVGVILLAVALFYRCFLLYSDTLLKSRAPILLPRTNMPDAVMLSTSAGPLPVVTALPAECNESPNETDFDASAALAGEVETADHVAVETVCDPVAFADSEAAVTESPVTANADLAPSENAISEFVVTEHFDNAKSVPNVAEPSGNRIPEEKLLEYKAYYQLSVRETEVLREILLDHSISEIAEILFISPRTVKFHISSLLRKTGASSQHRLKHLIEEYDKMTNAS